jgi:queuine tRNA-ribosyltransferase
MSLSFTVTAKDPETRARNGHLVLPHGSLETPVFMPVGTKGTVKGVIKDSLHEIGFGIILSNTYHLYLRPGLEIIKKAGGLHSFMNWNGNILTDSGGFQVFSLTKLRKIREDGVVFQSHIDGSKHTLTPEKIVDVQQIFGSDIFMQLDVCTPWGIPEAEAKKALGITKQWATRSMKHWKDNQSVSDGNLFPIMQGNFYKELRKESRDFLLELDSPGIAIGGLSVGEPFPVFEEFLAYSTEELPDSKPRYVMGIGTPLYILTAVENGVDMFDCVFPTRTARNGLLFTWNGPISIKQAQYTEDFSPVDSTCTCKVCREYSRAYLRHLYKCNEILYSMLASYHNLFFLHELMKKIRYSIQHGTFSAFKREFLQNYHE